MFLFNHMSYLLEIHMSKKDSDLYCNLKLYSLGLLQLESGKQNKTKPKTPDTTERNGGENRTRNKQTNKKVTVAQHYT